MPLVNPTDFPIIAATTSGTDLADRLNRLFDAYESNQFNPTRPLQLQKGGLWTRAEQNGDLTLLFYDGANDHEIGVVSSTGSSLFGSGKPLALEFDITHDYKKDEIIYDKATKTYYVAKAAVPKGQPWNVGQWTLLTNVFNEIHQSTGGGLCHVGALPPDPPLENGMMWYDVTDPNDPVFKVYHDGIWDNRGFAKPKEYDIRWLMAAGGGAGGGGEAHGGAGGGGAGGLKEGTVKATIGGIYNITVGAGGNNSDGGDSSIAGIGKVWGGGRGAGGGGFGSGHAGNPGGSGGGGSSGRNAGGAGGAARVPGEGFPGGAGAGDAPSPGGAGGGGAGEAGKPGNGHPSFLGGVGGNGVESDITGVLTYYCGGGGGGHGEGMGTNAASGLGAIGRGGHGGGNGYAPGGAGADGAVIFKIAKASYSGKVTGNPTVVQVVNDMIITWTQSGSYEA